MSGKNIIAKNSPVCNGQTHLQAFCKAFNINSAIDNRIVRATRQFTLPTFKLTVPKGSVGNVLDTCEDGRIFVDFGFRQCVAILQPFSPLIEYISLADELSSLRIDINQFGQTLDDLEQKCASLKERMEAGR